MTEVEMLTQKIRHRAIHHQDALDDMRIKLTNVLEGELHTILEKAVAAHAKGKAHVVEYQLADALDTLKREIERLK